MKVDDYKLLVTIKRVGTIRGAAKELLISQPAISLRLKQIEEQWGEKIFIRTHKNILVTPVGEKILAFGEEMIMGERKLLDDISLVSKSVNGMLSLGVSSVVGQYLLPEILESYINKYPDVKIELVTGLSQSLRASISDFHISIIRARK
ncbi:LysR family transcriptional regulator [Anaerobacillus sp. CMMVII]|uniref:LysR family transcriptional regulator n=1 Tax=Anaerobacillus sp. CMMVII TaxID=2755588 RepID=UPI0021B7E0DD|nr:LysR family transcriptional regulator [Anaerobacillus sp. CMMVII]MCT8138039.1 LysR family transcriptional regulator [Anaerobacillus sp. CMMVII]